MKALKIKIFPFLALILAFCLPLGKIRADSLTNGLVAYYRCNGNGLDSSSNGINGTLSNGVTTVPDRFGNPNGALYFGTNLGQVTGTGLNLANSSSSISLWVNKQYVGNGSNGGWILHVGSNGAAGQAMMVALDYGQSIRYSFFYDDLDTQTPTLSENVWYNLTFTYDSTTNQRNIYVNGNVVTSDTASYGFSGSSYFNIGNQANIELNDVRFYNRVLSQSEVTALYNLPEASPHHRLVIRGAKRSITTTGTIANIISVPIDNASLINAVVSGTTGLRAEDMDIAMSDLTGEIDVIQKTPAKTLYFLGYADSLTSVDAQLHSTNPRARGEYTIMTNYLFNLPLLNISGPVRVSMFLKSRQTASGEGQFANTMSQFFGGFDEWQPDSYIFNGTAVTTPAMYEY